VKNHEKGQGRFLLLLAFRNFNGSNIFEPSVRRYNFCLPSPGLETTMDRINVVKITTWCVFLLPTPVQLPFKPAFFSPLV
jgi:hypothetical protein